MEILGYILLTLLLAALAALVVGELFRFSLRLRYWLRTWATYPRRNILSYFSLDKQQRGTPVHRVMGQWLAHAWNSYSLKEKKKWRQGFYACILFLLIVLALWQIPEIQLGQFSEELELGEEKLLRLKNEYRRTIAQIIAGFAIIIGLFFTWKRIRATEEQVSIAREGQITERFTRAVDQLGSKESIHVRLGGIYALERISRDSPTDYGTVMEVLTAFVRERAPLPPPELEGKELGDQTPQEKLKPTTDIQAVLTVLGRRETETGVLQEMPLDLNSTDLKGADIKNAQLEKANLIMAVLSMVHLSGANLRGADLTGVKGLIQAQIDKTFYCEGTEPPKLSAEFKPPPARKCDERGNPVEE